MSCDFLVSLCTSRIDLTRHLFHSQQDGRGSASSSLATAALTRPVPPTTRRQGLWRQGSRPRQPQLFRFELGLGSHAHIYASPPLHRESMGCDCQTHSKLCTISTGSPSFPLHGGQGSSTKVLGLGSHSCSDLSLVWAHMPTFTPAHPFTARAWVVTVKHIQNFARSRQGLRPSHCMAARTLAPRFSAATVVQI